MENVFNVQVQALQRENGLLRDANADLRRRLDNAEETIRRTIEHFISEDEPAAENGEGGEWMRLILLCIALSFLVLVSYLVLYTL